MDFFIDINGVEEAKVTYEKGIKDLKVALDRLNSSLRFLREDGFQGQAKEAFFDILYADWEIGFTQHISDIEFLRDILQIVIEESKLLKPDGNKLVDIL